ncbi:hypothetical protein Rumeso_01627 [Rubellimicrobium mesophilum DSM 19309]|uniref:Uncharacterized protein n=1 Tax=Rubellimicrobium mesophilum DSM 19309 TaxID=442562 RepID=A0A017HSE3_9RHOB|nr:hypothetical protein Rumeso_01627 [Rubellimicrobium mesophilum DSM 19309]
MGEARMIRPWPGRSSGIRPRQGSAACRQDAKDGSSAAPGRARSLRSATFAERANGMPSAVASDPSGQDRVDSMSELFGYDHGSPKLAGRNEASLGRLSFDRLFPARGPMFERRDHASILGPDGTKSRHGNGAVILRRGPRRHPAPRLRPPLRASTDRARSSHLS